jgi:hypothetical protein
VAGASPSGRVPSSVSGDGFPSGIIPASAAGGESIPEGTISSGEAPASAAAAGDASENNIAATKIRLNHFFFISTILLL